MVTLTEQFGLMPAPNLFGHLFGVEGPVAWRPPEAPPLHGPATIHEPDGAALHPFQREGVQFLTTHPSALLGDEMGLGKSIQAIVALRLLLYGGDVRRALILAPKTVFWDWYAKLRLWAPDLTVLPVEGPKRRREWYWSCDSHIFIAGYETYREDCELVPPDRFDLVILDEIQRIKNPNTAAAQAVRRLGAHWRWGLSGTPLENKLDELVAVCQAIKPDLLPSAKGLAPEYVREAVTPFVLRRRKADVLQSLPPKTSRVVWLDLTPPQRAAYDMAERQGIAALAGNGAGANATWLLALLGRLKQICNRDEATGASCKCDYLLQELPSLRQTGDKALIFSQYPDKTLKPILPRLAPFRPALFDGSMRDSWRQELVMRFQQTEEPWVLAMSLKAGGVGLTLTRANHVYHFDQWWNPAAAEQAEDRVHRIGQRQPVQVTTLLTRGTIEERIAEMLERKRELFRQVMDPLTAAAAPEEEALPRAMSREEMLRLLGI